MHMLQYRINNKIWFAVSILILLFAILFFFSVTRSKSSDDQIKNFPEVQTFPPSANSFSSYVPYSGNYRYGINPGWYGNNWSTQQIATLAMGNAALNVKGLGVKTLEYHYTMIILVPGELILYSMTLNILNLWEVEILQLL
jgi:hypothetical protein